jgi:AcrR family transcriptional regulator
MAHQSTRRNTKRPRARTDARAYVSPLRKEQAEQTRQRIIEAFAQEVATRQTIDITLRQVAARAGVSVPTLYRSFASLEALTDAFWTWVEPQLGSWSEIESADDLPSFAENLFARFAEHEPLIRAMVITSAGQRIRARSVRRRNDAVRRALAPLTEGMTERDALAVTALCKVMVSGYAFHLMRDDWGVEGAEAGRAVAWALRTLLGALRRKPNTLSKEKRST